MEFVQRMKFWIGVGLLVLVSGAVLGLWFVPARLKNGRRMDEWRQKSDEVDTYAQKKRFPSQQSIDQVQALKEDYEQDLQQAMQTLRERDRLLERYIGDPETGEEGPREYGEWTGVYDAAMTVLAGEIRKSFVVAPRVVRRTFGDIWVEVPEMRSEDKRYWVQKYLMESLAQLNDVRMVVPVFSSFRFMDSPERLLHPSHGEMFRPIGFEMVIATEFQSVPRVLEQLLACEAGVSITSVEVRRRDSVAAHRPAGTAASAAREARASVASRVSASPSARMPGGPPPGAGAAAAAAAAAAQAQARARVTGGARGMRSGGRGAPSRGPSGLRGTTGELTPEEEADIARLRTRKLLDVTIRGYVEDYAPPAAVE